MSANGWTMSIDYGKLEQNEGKAAFNHTTANDPITYMFCSFVKLHSYSQNCMRKKFKKFNKIYLKKKKKEKHFLLNF